MTKQHCPGAVMRKASLIMAGFHIPAVYCCACGDPIMKWGGVRGWLVNTFLGRFWYGEVHLGDAIETTT